MKIKEVCVRTDLTDKTIRHYIDNGLLFPEFSESYSGRKSYSFSEEDVEQLKRIAILRKYRFSIKSIKSLLNNEIDTAGLIDSHIKKLDAENNENYRIIDDLKLLRKSDIDFNELCRQLEAADADRELPEEDVISPYVKLYNKMKKNSELIECALAVAVGLIFILLVFISDGFSERFADFAINTCRSSQEYVFCFFAACVAAMAGFAIIGILLFINKSNVKKTFALLELTCAEYYFVIGIIISIMFVWWLALIIIAVCSFSLRKNEKMLFEAEVKQLEAKKLDTAGISFNKFKTKISSIILLNAIGMGIGLYLVYFICPVIREL